MATSSSPTAGSPDPSSTSIPTMSTDITPAPSQGPPGGSSIDNGGPSLASSASLYRTSTPSSQSAPTTTVPGIIRNSSPPAFTQSQSLTVRPINEISVYTFLATLVLLLSVSAAIVVRSFLLRRRHRRMIEEAIRNGTWVPPVPGSGRNGPRVDLSKKPKMWEAYLDLHHQQQQPQQQMMASMSSTTSTEEKDWEGMRPLMVNYVYDSAGKKSANRNGGAGTGVSVSGGSGGGGGGEGMSDEDDRGTMARGRRLFRGLARTIGRAISPTPSGTPFGTPSNRGTGNNNMRQGSNANLPDVQLAELGGSNEPPKVRVAVLIAMPRQHSSNSTSNSSSSSPSTSMLLSASRAVSPPRVTEEEEEELLPHIEMGVAELAVSDSSPSNSMDGASSSAHHHVAKGKVRESMLSVGSA